MTSQHHFNVVLLKFCRLLEDTCLWKKKKRSMSTWVGGACLYSGTLNASITAATSECLLLGTFANSFSIRECWSQRDLSFGMAVTNQSFRDGGILSRTTSQVSVDEALLLWRMQMCHGMVPTTRAGATRYVLGKLAKERSFSRNTRLNVLNWESLEHRRTVFRLKLFYEVYFSQNGMPRESYIFPPHHISARIDHIYKVRERL